VGKSTFNWCRHVVSNGVLFADLGTDYFGRPEAAKAGRSALLAFYKGAVSQSYATATTCGFRDAGGLVQHRPEPGHVNELFRTGLNSTKPMCRKANHTPPTNPERQ
jgi:hypothetical protein